jgi:cell wall-associated NlpC family hydrolase
MLIAATVVAVISFSWLAPANCAPAPSLAQQKAAAERRTAEVKQKLDALNKDLEEAIQQYDLANLQLAEVQSRIADVSQQLAVALSSLQAKQQELSECVVAMYEQRPTDILDVIFSSRNFDDLSQQLDSFRKLGLQSSEVVRQVQQYADTVKQMRDRLAEQRVQARDLVEQVAVNRASIEVKVARQQEIFASAKAEVKRIEKQEAAEAAAAARRAAAAAAQWGAWRNPRQIPSGPLPPGHPEVIAIAQKYLGVPYVYGAADPRVGFDCSGLVMYCYAQIGITLPHYSGYQQNMGVPVPMTELRPGDLVFMGYPVSYHVALYAGNGTVIEAPHTGDVVKYWPVAGFQYAVRLP